MNAGPSARQRIMIDLSLQILRRAMARSGTEKVDTVEVRLALRCLQPHCPAEWLTYFWESTSGDNEIGRSQNCSASFNGIVRQLRLAGRYPDS